MLNLKKYIYIINAFLFRLQWNKTKKGVKITEFMFILQRHSKKAWKKYWYPLEVTHAHAQYYQEV